MHVILRWPSRSAHASLVIAVGLLLCRVEPARADVSTLDGTLAPIVRINVGSGDVTVRTWDREAVQIDGDPSLEVVRRTTHEPTDRTPMLIPQASAGRGDGRVVLAPESFVVTSIPPGPRESILIRSTPQTSAGPVAVTVPNDAVFVFAATHGNANLDVHDYRGGTFVGFTNRGRLSLENVGGTVFAQTGRGPLSVSDSSIERLRARSLVGNVTFERCRVRQIEASSVDGSIVYDNGSFEPGLARFESSRGDVAIGTQGAAELGAHVAGDGHVFTNFSHRARITGVDGATSAVVGGGGPVVNATTESGNVYLYDGTLRTRDQLPQPWRQPTQALGNPSTFFSQPTPAPIEPPTFDRIPAGPVVRPESAARRAPPTFGRRPPDRPPRPTNVTPDRRKRPAPAPRPPSHHH